MSNRYKYWDIVHWKYAPSMAAQEGWGIVFDNSEEGKPYWRWKTSPIFGYVRYRQTRNEQPQSNYEMGEVVSTPFFSEDWINNYHVECHPNKVILDGIRYSVYLLHKRKFLDNLSLIEILDKLNEYARRI